MFSKSKVFLAAALILGSAVAALANDQTDERGGFVIPGSMDGVNPVYHPDIFGSGGKALGRAAKPTVQQDRSQSGKPAYTR
jgi:hypothetical protein